MRPINTRLLKAILACLLLPALWLLFATKMSREAKQNVKDTFPITYRTDFSSESPVGKRDDSPIEKLDDRSLDLLLDKLADRILLKMAEVKPSADKQKSTEVTSSKEWASHIQTSCRKLGFYENQTGIGSKPSIDLIRGSQILVDDKHKLLFCQIPKVASTTWRRILITLSGKVNVKDPMSLSGKDVHDKYDEYLTYLGDLSTEDVLHRLNNYFKFVFVREPFERLLSAFRNKFVTTTNSSLYFRRIFGRKIIKKYRPEPPVDNTGSDVKFEEFISYLIDPDKKIPMNEHWDRFHKLCHPCLITYDFIGKLESMEEDSQYILNNNSLSEKVKIPSRYGGRRTSSYMTNYYSQISRESLKALYKMYEADFVIFNYTVPDVIKRLMESSKHN